MTRLYWDYNQTEPTKELCSWTKSFSPAQSAIWGRTIGNSFEEGVTCSESSDHGIGREGAGNHKHASAMIKGKKGCLGGITIYSTWTLSELIHETFYNLQTILTWSSIVSHIWKGDGKEVIILIVPSLLNQHSVVVALSKHLCDGGHPHHILLLRRLDAPHVHVEDLQVEGSLTGLGLIIMAGQVEVFLCHRIGEKPWDRDWGKRGRGAWMSYSYFWCQVSSYFLSNTQMSQVPMATLCRCSLVFVFYVFLYHVSSWPNLSQN